MGTKITNKLSTKIVGIGKRKTAVAQVFIFMGKGNFIINEIPEKKYLQFNLINLNKVWGPLRKLNLEKHVLLIHEFRVNQILYLGH